MEQTLFDIVGLLASEFPRGELSSLCNPLKSSIEAQIPAGGPSFDSFKDKVFRRQKTVLTRIAQKQLYVAEESAKEALRRDSVEIYTKEFLSSYLSHTDGRVSFEDLPQQLILIYRTGYYVFNGKGYSYAVPLSLLATIRAYLLYRAEKNLRFSYFAPALPGKEPEVKTADAFVRDNGGIIEQIRYNYSGNSYFDPHSKTLWLSEVSRPERIPPKRHEEVDAWMTAFCPDQRS